MKADDTFGVILLCLVLASMTGICCYDAALNKGYEKGINHSRLFYEATGEFPFEKWVYDTRADKFYTIQDIEDSLSKYNIPFKLEK